MAECNRSRCFLALRICLFFFYCYPLMTHFIHLQISLACHLWCSWKEDFWEMTKDRERERKKKKNVISWCFTTRFSKVGKKAVEISAFCSTRKQTDMIISAIRDSMAPIHDVCCVKWKSASYVTHVKQHERWWWWWWYMCLNQKRLRWEEAMRGWMLLPVNNV